MIIGKIAVLVCFFFFDCFGCFWVMDGWFIDFMILGDSTTPLWCIDVYSFGGLGVS